MPNFRVLQKIHLGGSDTALNQNEVISYDKKTLIREDGKAVELSSPDALSGAIKLGWIVPEESPERSFRPQPAGVEVRSAVSMSETREVVKITTVSDEERSVGNRDEVRAKSERGSQTPSGEGRVIGTLKEATDARSRVVVQHEDRVVRAVATGDVQEAISAENLEDLLPDATSSERPEPGIYQEKPTQNSYDIEIPKTPEARVELLASWVRNRDSHIPPMQLRGLVSEVLGQLVEARDTTKVEGDAIIHLSPEDFTVSWDLKAHWKTRQKALKEYWGDKAALTWIAENDPSRGILKIVSARLSEMG
jgi:hypothetical protein